MSGLDAKEIYGIIEEVVEEVTLYLRHYIGKVVDNQDITRVGRVKVAIEELGFDTPDLGIWCQPRQGHAMTVPVINSYVEVYFINGERERPVYIFPATEIMKTKPKSYIGDVRQHIIFESPEQQADNILFDAKQRLLTILEGSESAVLGDALLSWITDFITNVFNAHKHSGVTVGAGVTGIPDLTGTAPSDILSSNIKVK